MGLVDHAQTELTRAGLFDEDSDYGGMLGNGVLDLIRLFADQGHSGFSAMQTIDIFSRVASYKTLTPLTDDPEEWQHVGEPDMWQNRRSPSCFSKDGGVTYYDLDDHQNLTQVSEKSKALT